MKKQFQTRELTKMALMVALISVSAYIVIPIPFSDVSVTAQTLVVNLIALLLTPTQALVTMIVYILMGFIGLPIFSTGVGGVGKLFGPTGGYIFSWMVTVYVISLLKGKEGNLLRYIVVTIFVGMPISYIFGTAWMKYVTDMTWTATVAVAVLPFIPLDIAKCVAAALITKPIERAIRLGNL